jgi:hypothetical protein
MNKLTFSCQNVAGGWQTVYHSPDGSRWPLGPVMNNVRDLWDWQRETIFAEEKEVA